MVELFGCYGVRVWPTVVAASVKEAAAAAANLGYPVALKATAEHLRHRPDLSSVRLGLGSEAELRAAYATMWDFLGGAEAGLAVQAMAPAGVAAVVGVTEDPSFGALVSFGLAGVATDLLEDRAFRTLPLTDLDVADLVRSIRAAPLLFGYRGAEPVDVPALQDVLLRVGRLADQIPEVAEVVILSLIHISEPTRLLSISYAVFCLKKKKKKH